MCLSQHFPQVFAYYHPLASWFSLIADSTKNGPLCTFFQRSWSMGGVNPSPVGISWYLSLPIMFLGGTGDSARVPSPLPCRGMGTPGEAPTWYGISFNSTGQGGGGEMAFRLVAVWTHPHQACLSSLDEVPKKLTLFINLGNNWAYAFVQLNEDAQNVPLCNEGHFVP